MSKNKKHTISIHLEFKSEFLIIKYNNKEFLDSKQI